MNLPGSVYYSKTDYIDIYYHLTVTEKLKFVCATLDISVVNIDETLPKLHVHKYSMTSGFIYPQGYDGVNRISQEENFCSITIPLKHSILLSFVHLDVLNTSSVDQRIFIISDWEIVTFVHTTNDFQPQLFTGRTLTLRYTHINSSMQISTGFKARFSFLQPEQEPRYTKSTLIDCSGSSYEYFKDHVMCNGRFECEHRVDELNCSHTSPACNGDYSIRDKCYTVVDENKVLDSQSGSAWQM